MHFYRLSIHYVYDSTDISRICSSIERYLHIIVQLLSFCNNQSCIYVHNIIIITIYKYYFFIINFILL